MTTSKAALPTSEATEVGGNLGQESSTVSFLNKGDPIWVYLELDVLHS